MDDRPRIDYFAVSLPDVLVFETDLARKNRAHCCLMGAMGHLGLGDGGTAEGALAEALALDPALPAAVTLRALLSSGFWPRFLAAPLPVGG